MHETQKYVLKQIYNNFYLCVSRVVYVDVSWKLSEINDFLSFWCKMIQFLNKKYFFVQKKFQKNTWFGSKKNKKIIKKLHHLCSFKPPISRNIPTTLLKSLFWTVFDARIWLYQWRMWQKVLQKLVLQF